MLQSSFWGRTFAPLQNAHLAKCCAGRIYIQLENYCWALLDGYRSLLGRSRAQSPHDEAYGGKFATLPAMNSCFNNADT